MNVARRPHSRVARGGGVIMSKLGRISQDKRGNSHFGQLPNEAIMLNDGRKRPEQRHPGEAWVKTESVLSEGNHPLGWTSHTVRTRGR
ncbi:hypothetical protein S40285_09899 [Stachybotrys chlorohalonatus IBT 40285]|uniref:Uncharacterized protein n=1 Tax=Stachybotrys chlorohalonatus (strain IBT 40285) TaxID=1283841 RepID=A0A084QR53_STAC4|nr:hypothetical protein S40285_09899 [Stachybotrys chlorohalonata IBT 40285]